MKKFFNIFFNSFEKLAKGIYTFKRGYSAKQDFIQMKVDLKKRKSWNIFFSLEYAIEISFLYTIFSKIARKKALP